METKITVAVGNSTIEVTIRNPVVVRTPHGDWGVEVVMENGLRLILPVLWDHWVQADEYLKRINAAAV